MAQWSQKVQDQKKAEKLAAIVIERVTLFQAFRKAGWEANCHTDLEGVVLDDALEPVRYRVRMPGAMAAIVPDLAALRRLVKGVQ